MPSFRISASLAKLLSQVNDIAPRRSKKSDGWIGDDAHARKGSASDHNPWVRDGSTGIVTAIDITHDPAHGCDAGKIVDDLVSSRDGRIKYIIHNQKISAWVITHGNVRHCECKFPEPVHCDLLGIFHDRDSHF